MTADRRYRRDPRWQQANGNFVRDDIQDTLGASGTARFRREAIDEMFRLELTEVHDRGRCKARRLAKVRADLAHMQSELGLLREYGRAGKISADSVRVIAPGYLARIKELERMLPDPCDES
jgi:hypothetical protein